MGVQIMANYTITLYDLLDDPFYNLFDFDYPFYTDDETRKKEFEQKFIMTYMRYEIGFETGYDFKHELKTRLHMVMPYYKQLYESELKSQDIDFLLNKDLVEEFTRTLSSEDESNMNSTSNASSSNKSTSSIDSNSSGENSGSDLNNGLSNADADNRKTSHSKDKSNSKTNSNDQSTFNQDTKGNTQATSTNNTTESTRFVSRGNIGVTSSAELLEKWRSVMINIDQQLVDECRDLFAMIYFSFSIDQYR